MWRTLFENHPKYQYQFLSFTKVALFSLVFCCLDMSGIPPHVDEWDGRLVIITVPNACCLQAFPRALENTRMKEARQETFWLQ